MKSPSSNYQKLLLKLLLSYQTKATSEGGFVVVMAMAMVLFLSLLVLSYAVMSKVDTTTQDAVGKSKTGFYAAEAGLNLRAKAIRNLFEGYNRPAGTSPANAQACTDSNTSNNGTGDFVCQTATFQGSITSTYGSELAGNPTLITINEGEVYRGLSAQEYRYDLYSTAFDSESLPTAILGMRFKSRLVPLFQFAAFYNKDLEILPGADMNLSGPVHSNFDLYLNSNATLRINGQVTVSSNLYRGRKNATNDCGGTVGVFDPTNPTTLACAGGTTQITDVDAWNGLIRLGVSRLQLPPEGMLNPVTGAIYWDRADLRVVLKLDNSGNPTAIEVRNANNTVDTTRTSNLLNSCTVASTTLSANAPTNATNGAANAQISVASTTGFAVGDVLTVGSDNDSNVITNITGNTITLRRKFAHPYQGNVLSGAAVRDAVVSTSDTFFNYREQKFIRMLDVDVRELLNCAQQVSVLESGRGINDTTEGGLVWYFTVEGPNSNIDMTSTSPPADGNNYGIRLRNAGELSSTVAGAPAIQGLTVVTNQAVYIVGNYNSVNKKPASFLADTINVLSGNWLIDDSRSRTYDTNNLPIYTSSQSGQSPPYQTGATNVNDRVASPTTINAAFLAGTDTTGGADGTAGRNGAYNGGLENYPRLHEHWSGQALFYRGSFVSLNRSRKVDGPWCGTGGSATIGCNIYNAPNRNWDYDTDYNNAANLPPLSPRFVYLKQEVFSRNFDRP